jgi:RNA polymerase sigma-70 factor (ECF subfamily)
MVAATLIEPARTAFERLFAEEYRRVTSVAYRITRDAAEAEDVAQEVFVQFARAKRISDDRARAWLCRTAVHTALNAVRSRERRTRREQRDFHLSLVASRDDDPQQIVERRAQAALVRKALLRINRKEAELLALRYGGLSYREIAQAAGIDAAQVGTRLSRAERALRREIERETVG